ncbi:MMPL family transporter, partial [Candidatus Aerophobetes bacterium]|nr:MMPL family transporter [Candidatus Aerophobetes bacterium]
ESILVSMNEFKNTAKIDNISRGIIPLLPDQLKKDEKFQKSLKDNLWEINEKNVALTLSRYTKITGADPEPIHFTTVQTGIPTIFKNLDRSLIRSQITSFIIAIMLVFGLIAFQLRSLTGGLIGITPITLTVLLNFAVMAYLKVPLDMATVLVGSIAIGIGIDYTIHFISRFKTEFEVNKTELGALDKTLETTGRAIIINAFSVMMGFLALLLSSIVPLQRFGWLTGLTMAVSALGAICLLPALLLITKTRFIGNFGRPKAISNKLKGR